MRIKVRTPERKVTVRIVAQTPSDRFLLLQKNERSHVPGKYELPGGVVKGRKTRPLPQSGETARVSFRKKPELQSTLRI